MKEKLQQWSPWVVLVNLLLNVVLLILGGLYINLPKVVAEQGISIRSLQDSSKRLDARMDKADQEGSIAAKAYMDSDKQARTRQDAIIDQLVSRVSEHDAHYATILERTATIQRMLEKHMESK